ncbi:hypothetical protein J2808_003645 [Pseudarthrobacter sulfonivorans]|nr:hypothetical protein [Pseudarthrobacter sulfonivorans]
MPVDSLIPLSTSNMYVNLLVSEGRGRRLDEPNAKAHTSKSEFLGQVACSDVQRHRHRQKISAGRDFVRSHEAGLLKHLEDA